MSLGYDADSGCSAMYACAGPPNGILTSFNFLHYRDGRWYLVSQPEVSQSGGMNGNDVGLAAVSTMNTMINDHRPPIQVPLY